MTEKEITEVRRRLEARGGIPGPKPRRPRYVEASVMLDREETDILDTLAAEEGRSRSWMIREAIRRTWLKGRRREGRPDIGRRLPAPPRLSREERAQEERRFDALLTRIRSRLPPDVTPEEIETDITAAVADVRAQKRAARGR